MYRGAERITEANAATALAERIEVDVERAKRRRSTAITMYSPISTGSLIALLVPLELPLALSLALMAILIVGIAALVFELVSGEVRIRGLEHRMLEARARCRELQSSAEQRALPRGEES